LQHRVGDGVDQSALGQSFPRHARTVTDFC
jgi:hypothetical protein